MLEWLSSLKLTLEQWLLLLSAATIGVLVVMMRLQGSRLHKAQLDALNAQILLADASEETKIAALKQKLAASLEVYNASKD